MNENKPLNANSSIETAGSQSEIFMDHLSDLISFTEQKLSASTPPQFIVKPDQSKWTKWKKLLYSISYPFDIIAPFDIKRIMKSLIWLIISTGWVVYALVLFDAIFGPRLLSNTGNSSQWFEYIFPITLFILSLLGAISIHVHTIAFIKSSKNQWEIRILWVFLLLVFILFFRNQALIYYPMTFPSNLVHIVQFALPFLGWLLFFLLPFLYFFVTLILCGSILIFWSISFVVTYFLRANTPYPLQILRQLINSPIGKSGNQWKLIDLSPTEVDAIREWARDNREGTDKRIVPATLFIAIFGIFASTEPFMNFMKMLTGQFNSKLFDFFHAKDIFAVPFDAFITIVVILPIVFDIIVLLIVAYISLFRNLVVQSLIIEATTVAKYGVETNAQIKKDQVLLSLVQPAETYYQKPKKTLKKKAKKGSE